MFRKFTELKKEILNLENPKTELQMTNRNSSLLINIFLPSILLVYQICDSKSVLESIEIQESKNPIMIEILDLLQHLVRENFIVEFCWLPSHVGISGNEKADDLAKAGLNLDEPRRLKVPFTDFKTNISNFIKQQLHDMIT